MLNLPGDVIRIIFEYDNTKFETYNKVIQEFKNFLEDYDRKFWNFNMMKRNVYNSYPRKSLYWEKWLENYGIIYEPVKYFFKEKRIVKYKN